MSTLPIIPQRATYRRAEPDTKVPLLKKMVYAARIKRSGFAARHEQKINDQRERALDNANFAVVNQVVVAALAIGGGLALSGASGLFGEPGKAVAKWIGDRLASSIAFAANKASHR